MGNIGFEMFKSVEPIRATEFYVYNMELRLAPKSELKTPNIINVLNSLCLYLNTCVGVKHTVFYRNDEVVKEIISTIQIPAERLSGFCYNNQYTYLLNIVGKKELDVQDYKECYARYVYDLLRCGLGGLQQYDIADGIIRQSVFHDEDDSSSCITDSKGMIRLEKVYNFNITIDEDNYLYLTCNFKHEFVSTKTVAELKEMGISVLHKLVKYIGETSYSQSGYVINESAAPVGELIIPNTVSTLREYMLQRARGKIRKIVSQVPDDYPSIEVEQQCDNKRKILSYYPQLCVPIYTFEDIANQDGVFAKKVMQRVKLNMRQRIVHALAFINNVNRLNLSSSVGNIQFLRKMVNVQDLGWKAKVLAAPKFVFADGCTGSNKHQCFKYGMFGDTVEGREKINILYIVPKNSHNVTTEAFTNIFRWNKFFKKCFSKIKNNVGICGINYEVNGVLEDLMMKVRRKEYYRTYNIDADNEKFDIALIGLPKGHSEDGRIYEKIKAQLARHSIPSQAMEYNTLELIAKSNKNITYHMENIWLGIYAKLGGLAFTVGNIPSGVDCFLGVDVAMETKGLHHPACVAAFIGNGTFLGWYLANVAQTGEKIPMKNYERLFEPFVSKLKDFYHGKRLSVVLLRDGKFLEDSQAFVDMWDKLGADVSIFEVLKSNVGRLWENSQESYNPTKGICIVKDNEAIIVTTSPRRNQGAPRPIRIRKVAGTLPIEILAVQAYYLSEMHVGTTHTSRLPVPIDYADKICKSREYLPSNTMCNQLYFL